MKPVQENEEVCCPRINPEEWNDKILKWENKKFVKGSVRTLFSIPLNFGQVMKKLDVKIREANAVIQDGICLADHTSRWNMDLYLPVDKDIPGYENTTLNGNFFSRIYEGPFKDTGKWCQDYEAHAKLKGFNVTKWFMWYTTCPKCAKKYGKNYVAIISQVN